MPALARLHRFQSASQQNRIAKTKSSSLKSKHRPIDIRHHNLTKLQPVSRKNITHAMAHLNFQEAVECLVRDSDKKYDEVLVDRFADLIKLELSTHAGDWLQTCMPLVETLQHLIQDRAFVMFDQARAFKLLRAIVDSKWMNRQEFEGLQPLLDSFWASVPNVMVNNNLPAATVMLQILKGLWKTRFAHDWLLARQIKPQLEINHQKVKDLAGIAKFYLKSGNNYHTKNRAEELFQELLSVSYMMNLPIEHPLVDSLLKTVRELLLDGSDTIVTVIMKVLSKLNAKIICTNYGISDMIQESFEATVKKPKCNFIILCKCLALSGRRKFLTHNIKLLKENHRVEALIVYLISRPHYWDHCDLNEFVETYLMYPILSTCSDSDSKEITSRLKLNLSETQQIDKCNHPRLTLHCLIHLNQLLQNKKLIQSQLKPSSLPILMKMLTSFVKTHIDSIKHYKSMFESLSTLRSLLEHYEEENLKSFSQVINEDFDCMMSLFEENFTDNRKPILVSFLRLLNFMNLWIKRGEDDEPEDIQLISMYERIANMAFKYNDVEILEEFFNFFFYHADRSFLKTSRDLFIRLLWEHLLPKFRESTSSGQVLGSILVEFTSIDNIGNRLGIKLHNYDFVKMIGDILIEKATDYNVIQPLIGHFLLSDFLQDRLLQDVEVWDNFISDTDYSDSEREEISFMPQHPFDEKSFNRLVLGFCTAIWKADLPKEECLDGVRVIFRMIKIIIKTSSSYRRALNRLVKAGVLATIHGIASTSSYPDQIILYAKKIACYINHNVVVTNLEDCIFDELKVFHPEEDNPDLDKLRTRAKKLAEFYSNAFKMPTEYRSLRRQQEEVEETSAADNITLMVQNFLNYPEYDNTMDCH